MTSIRQVLRNKPEGACTISPKATIFSALQLLADKDIGALVVVEGENVVGIFSERDYARKVFLVGKNSKQTLVEDVMTRKVYYASPDQSIDDLMALMTTKHIRHLPVLENDKLLGVISIGDVVKTVIADHEFTIREMEKYITGSTGLIK
jgi:CBS domain-containing protein